MEKLCSKGKGNKMKKVEQNNDLPEVEKNNDFPSDVLGIIFRELDFDDLFEFAGVCKSWRVGHKYYLSNFMKSQSPLIVEKETLAKEECSFLSVPDLKFYRSTVQYFSGLNYLGSSSGYLIMAGCDKHNEYLLLMNPFTRRKKEISTSAIEGIWVCRALLAFVKGSEEFVIVVSSLKNASYGLLVYQSRNSSWITYPIRDFVVGLVVLHNTIYALTEQEKIGVLSLNSARVKFLDLKNTPTHPFNIISSLVTCDGQLLVVNFEPGIKLNVYKIDLSTMEYVKLETLGDVAIFYSIDNCHALSNPGRWGYDSNSVYCLTTLPGRQNPVCEVYSWNNELKKRITRDEFGAPSPKRNSFLNWCDWCFRHQHDEVDYSLVD